MIKVKDNRSSCPISTALEIIGDQWSLIVIRDLFLERTTFSEFRNSPEKISTNILTDRLNKLLSLDLIGYVKNPKNKKIKIYYLKDGGIELYPLLYELSLWSKKNLDMKFHPLSIDWYKAIEGRKPKEVISEISSSYKAFRKGILNEMVA
ncbi:helix-turn-helix transcriptional regulator [Flavobacteriaceae bacterium]|mgnify:FL=1|nr:helix-turn-helix transcriptional regulator [Flavobacteriaceae bacterium]